MIPRRHFLKVFLLGIVSLFIKNVSAEKRSGAELKEAMFWRRLDI